MTLTMGMLTGDGGTTTQTELANLFAQVGAGVVKTTNSVFDLNRLVVGAGSGMQVTVGSGRGVIRGHWIKSDATVNLAIAAAHATLARIDLVVLRFDDTLVYPGQMSLAVITGTPGASPAAPSPVLTATMEDVPLAQIAVGAAVSSILAGNVTDRREYQSAQTGILASVTASASQTLSTAAATAIIWTAAVVNWGAMWSSTTNPTRITCRVPGIYRAEAGVIYAANATADRQTALQKTGVTLPGGLVRENAVTGGGFTAQTLAVPPFEMAAGDYIELLAYQASGGNLGVSGSALGLTRLGAS